MTGTSRIKRRKQNRWCFPTTMLVMGLGEIALLPAGSGPQAKLAEGTPAHHPTSLLLASFLLDERHVAIKRQDFSMEPLDRHMPDERRVLVDVEALLWRINQEYDVLPGKSLFDVVGLLIDINTAIRADATRKGMPMNAL